MAQGFSLKDQLFNADTLGQLGREYAVALPSVEADAVAAQALSGVAERSLLECLDWFADCLEPHLPSDFPTMAAALEAAMPTPLDPTLTDDDFGQFIHAVPGVLAVRHGLEAHPDRALDLLYHATQRFSMEFYVRPFLNHWPDKTLARLQDWARDDNYHVRRLVSEGTRPKLPWAKAVTVGHASTMPLLDALHGDGARFVTRSVANHLNDIGKTAPDVVLDALARWRGAAVQTPRELDWMTRHALRSLIKDGHAPAMEMLGYAGDADVAVALSLASSQVKIGTALDLSVTLSAPKDTPVLVDYRIRFARPKGRRGEKVFKLKQGVVKAGQPLVMQKAHKLKGGASTFTLHPGAHEVVVQVNGVDRAAAHFDLEQ